jgi:undecaprenol kinase
MKNRSFRERLGFAVSGIATAWQREHSLRTQVGVATAVVAVLAIVRPPLLWVALIVLCIALVLALELVNAALEYLIDHLHPEIAPEIKHAKDAAAGAVLIFSIGACVVGLLMLIATVLP